MFSLGRSSMSSRPGAIEHSYKIGARAIIMETSELSTTLSETITYLVCTTSPRGIARFHRHLEQLIAFGVLAEKRQTSGNG